MRGFVVSLLLLTTACSFAHEYRSGEVPRLQVYGQEELSGVLRPCEFVTGGFRRDASGERLVVPTAIAEGPACSQPFSNYLLTLRKGTPATRVPTPMSGPGEGILMAEDGTLLGRMIQRDQALSFEFVGGPTLDGYVELHPDQGGAPYYAAWRKAVGTEIAALSSPRRVVARSTLRGPLFSQGIRHYLCGRSDAGSGEGACDVFDSDEPSGSWRAAGRLLFGNHEVIDMDPASNVTLVATRRDDLEPLLFTVDLQTWQWTYIGAGSRVFFMNVDPLGREQSRP